MPLLGMLQAKAELVYIALLYSRSDVIRDKGRKGVSYLGMVHYAVQSGVFCGVESPKLSVYRFTLNSSSMYRRLVTQNALCLMYLLITNYVPDWNIQWHTVFGWSSRKMYKGIVGVANMAGFIVPRYCKKSQLCVEQH